MTGYYAPQGGLPAQSTPVPPRSIFTQAYVYIPKEVMTDIVTSALPHWDKTRCWILARPLSGFAESFAQYIVEVAPGGGSQRPEPDPVAQAAVFVLSGKMVLTLDDHEHRLQAGSFAFVPAGSKWSVQNSSSENLSFSWIRKRFVSAPALEAPVPIFTSDQETPAQPMPDCGQKWSTSRFIDPEDLRYDMHLNIVSFAPGGCIPFDETHVMEHGLYMLQGQATYRVNQDEIAVQAGDFLWLRAFCPQSCVATGSEPFRYLLYKDVNRHPDLSI